MSYKISRKLVTSTSDLMNWYLGSDEFESCNLY